MSFDTAVLNIRKPLWIALSDLFLDTELQDYHFWYVAKEMKVSGYSLDEIEDILKLEVFPVCIANLYSVAGEWAGFNESWVCDTIVTAKRPNHLSGWLNSRSFSLIEDDWQKVLVAYRQL